MEANENRRTAADLGELLAYKTDRDMALSHDRCFLCGVEFDEDNRTDEHVFPRWLQRDHDLWNEELNLLNGTRIRYSVLTIPCCRDCNGYWLSQIENQVATAFREGPDAVERLDPGLLALWMGKIYYGIHFKELGLPLERRDPDGPTILKPDELARLSELHHVLQATRQRVRFSRPCGSVRVYTAQVPEKAKLQFDYRDSRLTPFIAIRAGAVVVLCSLLDWGAMAEGVSHRYFELAEELEIHPAQFAEIAAFGAYTATNFNREFIYGLRPMGDHDLLEPIMVLEPGANPEDPVFNPMNFDRYAPVLAEFTGHDVDDVYDREGQRIWSNLRNSDDSPAHLPLERVPVGVEVRPPKFD